jgi:hypothetical protein
MCVTVAVLHKLCLQSVFQVKVTEIVDVTDADSSIILSPEERKNNIQLEYDDEWLSQHVIETEGQYHVYTAILPGRVSDMFLNPLRYKASVFLLNFFPIHHYHYSLISMLPDAICSNLDTDNIVK